MYVHVVVLLGQTTSFYVHIIAIAQLHKIKINIHMFHSFNGYTNSFTTVRSGIIEFLHRKTKEKNLQINETINPTVRKITWFPDMEIANRSLAQVNASAQQTEFKMLFLSIEKFGVCSFSTIKFNKIQSNIKHSFYLYQSSLIKRPDKLNTLHQFFSVFSVANQRANCDNNLSTN